MSQNWLTLTQQNAIQFVKAALNTKLENPTEHKKAEYSTIYCITDNLHVMAN